MHKTLKKLIDTKSIIPNDELFHVVEGLEYYYATGNLNILSSYLSLYIRVCFVHCINDMDIKLMNDVFDDTISFMDKKIKEDYYQWKKDYNISGIYLLSISIDGLINSLNYDLRPLEDEFVNLVHSYRLFGSIFRIPSLTQFPGDKATIEQIIAYRNIVIAKTFSETQRNFFDKFNSKGEILPSFPGVVLSELPTLSYNKAYDNGTLVYKLYGHRYDRLLNNSLRKGILTRQTEQFYFSVINEIDKNGKEISNNSIIYRGVNDANSTDYCTLFSDNGFMSKTRSFGIASEFAIGGPNSYILLFPITDDRIYLDLDRKTAYDEKEVLTYPGEKYKTDKIYYIIYKGLVYKSCLCTYLSTIEPSYIIDEETSEKIDNTYDYIIKLIENGGNILIGDESKLHCKINNGKITYSSMNPIDNQNIIEFEMKLFINLCIYNEIIDNTGNVPVLLLN